MVKKYDYDAIIIGAGISGLVCGCYLAKAGMKTLIVEKNAKPGGYCTSFTRGGFQFDACVHSLCSLREGANIRTILKELELEKRLNILRFDPSDIIITPDVNIHFWNDMDKTINEFQDIFPEESIKIKEFFNYIFKCDGLSFNSLRSITFKTLLDRYFNDDKLKAILSLPLLGNAGLPSGKISAITGVLVYKEFMFDGGYYPKGSIQVFADSLLERFKELGGDVLLSCSVKKIQVKDRIAEGVETKLNDIFSANYIISNADATQTFISLIGSELIGSKMINLLNNIEPSLSAFVMYLGTDGNVGNMPENSVMWFMPHYDTDRLYDMTINDEIDKLDWFLARLSPDKNTILMLVNVPFNNEQYWKTNKKRLIDIYIRKMEYAIPGLSSHIVFKDAATPHTLFKWTSNFKGAAYGWARTPSQFAVTGFTQATPIRNLFLTGHWTTLAQGVSGVSYVGRSTAKLILGRTKIAGNA